MVSVPFIKEFDFAYGRADELSPLVTRIICENPGPFTYTGSGTYLIGTDEIALIDPGPINEAHLSALLEHLKGRKLTHILITHTHSDHCGGARDLATITGAPIYALSAHPHKRDDAAPALDEGADFDFHPDEFLTDDETISGNGWRLTAHHTPGHIGNHLCFSLREEKALFTGDHIMGWATTVVAPPDGDMGDYFNSLDMLIARDDIIYYPTHGAPITAPQKFVQAVKEHRLMRDAQVIEQLEKGRVKIMEMVQDMYQDIDPRLHIAAALNVEAHLAMHVTKGTVAKKGIKILDAEYHLI